MIFIILYLLLVAFLHAKLETMIEGRDGGWARQLPCWRLNVFIIKLIIGKELSGYHCYLMMLFLVLFHGPLLFIPWNIKLESTIMGLFIFYWVAEDYLFFVVNKHWGLMKFKPNCIPWHKRWFWGLPYSYWTGIIIGTILLLLGRS